MWYNCMGQACSQPLVAERYSGMTRTFRLLLAAVAIAAPLWSSAAAAQPWPIDPVHSTAQFTARHFGIVPVVGTIPIVKGSVSFNAGSQIPTAVTAQLDASKIDTHNDQRDADLRSEHFFNVGATPTLTFVSTKIDGTDPNHFTIDGDLTMHGQTHPVRLDTRVVGAGKSPRGQSLIAYAATATIDRTQWGMTYGPMIVGNSVDLALNVEAAQP